MLILVTMVTLGDDVVFGDNGYFLVITVILVNWDKTSFIFEFVFETSSWSFSISLCTESLSDMIIEYSCKIFSHSYVILLAPLGALAGLDF